MAKAAHDDEIRAFWKSLAAGGFVFVRYQEVYNGELTTEDVNNVHIQIISRLPPNQARNLAHGLLKSADEADQQMPKLEIEGELP